MKYIELQTEINAGIEKCFDLARSVDVHIASTGSTNEKAIAGRTAGLCELGDTITWEATHFGIRQRLSVAITKFEKPYFFEDQMTKGAFKSMRHEHHFQQTKGGTRMHDKFEYEVPFGLLGTWFDSLLLRAYLTTFLLERNRVIKTMAELAE